MSLVLYCPNTGCAHPNTYTLNIPNFCSACGQSLTVKSAAAVQKSQPPVPKPFVRPKMTPPGRVNRRLANRQPVVAEEDDFEYEPGEIVGQPLEITNIEFEIVGSRPKMTFKDLVESPTAPPIPQASPQMKMSQSEAMAIYKKEAQADRTPIEIEDNLANE